MRKICLAMTLGSRPEDAAMADAVLRLRFWRLEANISPIKKDSPASQSGNIARISTEENELSVPVYIKIPPEIKPKTSAPLSESLNIAGGQLNNKKPNMAPATQAASNPSAKGAALMIKRAIMPTIGQKMWRPTKPDEEFDILNDRQKNVQTAATHN